MIEIGQRYGKLEVLSEMGRDDWGYKLYQCLCDCGNYSNVRSARLTSGKTTSCGCKTHPDLIGYTFFSFRVIEKLKSNERRYMMWKCQCICGHEIVKHTKDIIRLKNSNKSIFECPNCKSNAHISDVCFNYVLRSYKQGAKRRNLDFELTDEQFKNLISKNCYYCDAKPSRKQVGDRKKQDYIYNGIDRLNNSKGYTIDNTVSCCSTCNYAKRDMTVDEYIWHCKRVFENRWG